MKLDKPRAVNCKFWPVYMVAVMQPIQARWMVEDAVPDIAENLVEEHRNIWIPESEAECRRMELNLAIK